MKIKVTYGIGEGATKLAAFDRALFDAGIANYNLIKLSSVIPENSEDNAKINISKATNIANIIPNIELFFILLPFQQ